MTYISPFSALKNYHDDIDRYQTGDILVWWNISELIEETKALISNVYDTSFDDLDMNELIKFIYNPTAIFSAFTNLIIRNIWRDTSFLNQIIELKKNFSDLAPLIYKMDDSIIESFDDFIEDIYNTKKDILGESWFYKFDDKSFESSFDWLSVRTWAEIWHVLDSCNTVFLALWNWGIAPWLDVINKIPTEANIVFRTARLSMEKSRDKSPRLSRREITDIKNRSALWNLIIFDEDSCTGKTLKKAVNYFDKKLPLSTHIFWLSNCWEFRTDNFPCWWIEY